MQQVVFPEHKTVFLEAEDPGIVNSVRGEGRFLHKPKLLMLVTEPHYGGPCFISHRETVAAAASLAAL